MLRHYKTCINGSLRHQRQLRRRRSRVSAFGVAATFRYCSPFTPQRITAGTQRKA